MSNYYDLAETESILRDIQSLGLERAESLDNASIIELQSQFNGCGSDSMPLVLRKALSKLLRLKCTVAIHDWDYYKSDGTKAGQDLADKRFLRNGVVEIFNRISWWRPSRYWALYKLSVAHRLLQKFGEESYISAHERFKNS